MHMYTLKHPADSDDLELQQLLNVDGTPLDVTENRIFLTTWSDVEAAITVAFIDGKAVNPLEFRLVVQQLAHFS